METFSASREIVAPEGGIPANRFITIGAGGVAALCGAGLRPDGVSVEDLEEGDVGTAIISGRAKVECAVALDSGQVECDANGRAIVLAAGVECGTVQYPGLAPSAVPEYDTCQIVFAPVEAVAGP